MKFVVGRVFQNLETEIRIRYAPLPLPADLEAVFSVLHAVPTPAVKSRKKLRPLIVSAGFVALLALLLMIGYGTK
jgi:hypothetical protein